MASTEGLTAIFDHAMHGKCFCPPFNCETCTCKVDSAIRIYANMHACVCFAFVYVGGWVCKFLFEDRKGLSKTFQ